jgi:predicted TPR repeat methyltransferase
LSENNTTSIVDLYKYNTEELSDYYDRWSESYDNDLEKFGYVAPRIAAELLSKQEIDRAMPVLDAGCGTGLTGLQLQRCGFDRITGVDISPASLEKARQKGCYRDLKQQNLNEPLDFAADQFAAAQCVGTLTHVENIAELMREFCRVVRPQGVVLFTQRTDLHDDRFKSVIDDVSAAGLWTRILRTGPGAYLPGHEDFSDEKKVIYEMYRVN